MIIGHIRTNNQYYGEYHTNTNLIGIYFVVLMSEIVMLGSSFPDDRNRRILEFSFFYSSCHDRISHIR